MGKRFVTDPVVEAAECGDVASLKRLLDETPSQVSARTQIGDTPLHCAAAQGQKAVCQLLLDRGADVNAPGSQGKTPLHYAAASGSVATAKFLLSRGASAEAADDRGQTPLQAAVDHVEVGRPETNRMVALLKKGSGGLDLRSAIGMGDERQVRAILAADPQAVSKHSDPGGLLLDAVVSEHDNVEIVRLVLDAGADPNRVSRGWPELPLFRTSNLAIVELLLNHGANPNVKDREGRTPLRRARKYKQIELEQLLLRFGATLNGTPQRRN